jgi:hypothetical protein
MNPLNIAVRFLVVRAGDPVQRLAQSLSHPSPRDSVRSLSVSEM